jgi:hypothetical protein
MENLFCGIRSTSNINQLARGQFLPAVSLLLLPTSVSDFFVSLLFHKDELHRRRAGGPEHHKYDIDRPWDFSAVSVYPPTP